MTTNNLDRFGDFMPHLATAGAGITAGTTVVSGGTEGSVLFVGSSGVIQQDNANFFWDDTDNQLVLGAGTVGKPSLIFGDDTTGIYRAAADQIGWALGGVAAMRLGGTGPDSDQTFAMGRALIDSRATDIAYFSHRDRTGTSNYALRQQASGATAVNCENGATVVLAHANTTRMTVNTTGIGFYTATPVAQQTGYTTFTNLVTDRTCDANATTVEELADILGTLIVDLKALGLIAA